jgi:hypothetical protein
MNAAQKNGLEAAHAAKGSCIFSKIIRILHCLRT